MPMTLLDQAEAPTAVSSAQWLRETTAAVRVSFTWMGVRKTLTPEQKNQAAEPFGAEGEYLSARKKLLDTRHEAYKEVTAVRGRVLAYWKSLTLPYPEPGIRLIRQHQIDSFNQEMSSLRGLLDEAVARLDDHYHELKSAAQHRLGDLFNPNDYPPSLRGLFGVEWDFPMSSRRTTSSSSIRPSSRRSGPALLPASSKPWRWPSRHSSASLASWWNT